MNVFRHFLCEKGRFVATYSSSEQQLSLDMNRYVKKSQVHSQMYFFG